MAPLPRYEDLGVRVAPVPQASTAGFEAAARAAGSLSDSLNRLSSFAFEEANKQARAEGLEFGVAKAPTPDQLKAALDAGEAPPIPGDMSSTFGRAAREGALTALRQSVEIEARNKIAELHATAKASNMAPAQYQKSMQDIIDGYGSSIAQASPATAFSVRASLATVASSQFISYSDWHLSKQLAQQKIAIVAGLDTIVRDAEFTVAAGDRIANSEAPGLETVVTAEQIHSANRTKILQYAASVNDPDLAKTKLKEYNDAVQKAQVAYVSTWAQDATGVPTMARYSQIMSGQFDPPITGNMEADRQAMRVKRMWDGMPLEQRTKVQDEVRRQMKATLELDSSLDAAMERQRKDARDTNRIDFAKAWEAGDRSTMERSLARMEQLRDAEGREKYGRLVGEQRSFTEPGLLFTLDQELARGSLTAERVITLVGERRLSDSDGRGYLPKIDASAEREFTEAMTSVKAQLGYPDKPLINPSAAQRKAEQQVQGIQAAMIAAKRDAQANGRPFNAYDFAQRQIAEIKTSGPSAEELNAAERAIGGLTKQLQLPESASLEQVRDALAARVASGKFNPQLAVGYQNQIRLLMEKGPR